MSTADILVSTGSSRFVEICNRFWSHEDFNCRTLRRAAEERLNLIICHNSVSLGIFMHGPYLDIENELISGTDLN